MMIYIYIGVIKKVLSLTQKEVPNQNILNGNLEMNKLSER